jgi:outer membrane lipoprotein SlyB
MTTQINKSPSPLMWVSTIAIVLFSGVGVAAFMGWLPASFGGPGAEPVKVVAVTKPVHKTPAQAVNNAPSNVAICTECGVIESIRAINSDGNTSGLGLVGGAVVGGLLGNQVGGGRGKDVATVVGAVGGAVAGNQIEKNVGSTRTYEVTVRFDNGSRRVFNETNPQWHAGDHVRVVDGVIRSDG